MTPAYLNTRRRALGLSIAEMAGLCDVQRRTVERWEDGTLAITDKAWSALDALEDAMHAACDATVDQVLTSGVASVTLWRYRTREGQDASPHASQLPGGAHAILTGWTADALEDAGIAVTIEWAD